jgi:hypothetical protein
MSTDTGRPQGTLLRLADRLAAMRHFVGREAELALFSAALEAETPPFAVLHLHGPGGIGKTSLLHQFARAAAAQGRTVALLDSRHIDPSPQGFLLALSLALGLSDPGTVFDALVQAPNLVLLLDTYETLEPLDDWLREHFLPQLPAQALVVIAGRNPAASAWRSDAAWQQLLRVVPLRNLHPEESLAYLRQRDVPSEQHNSVLGFTHGHPLALSLLADVTAQERATPFHPDEAPNLVAMLLERFVQEVPTSQHRLALHACASARVLTEPLLREALQEPDVQAIFAWLRTLSFIEQGPGGLFPHDLAREVLDSDLRWRDAAGYAELHRRLRTAIVNRILEGQGIEQMRATFDLVYLHRHNPVLQPYYQWQTFGTLYPEPIAPAEYPAVLQRIAEFQGEDAASLAEHWLHCQPGAWHLVRDPSGQIAGVFMYLALHQTSAEERSHDLTVATAWDYAQRLAPLRPADEVTFARVYVDQESLQHPSSITNTALIAIGLAWMTNQRLAWSFADMVAPEHWRGMMSYYNFHRVENQRFGLYAHDWRKTPLLDWIALISERELAPDLRVEELARASATPLLALAQPAFAEAVRAALRNFAAPGLLATSPLLRSRVAHDYASGPPSATTLQELLRHAARALQAQPRTSKFARALEVTYFSPALTQELAAERLGLPFSTYRYQLAQGIVQLTDWLWQREIYGADA